ncbi:MAG: hypothetical protein RJA25_1219 [Bacteroidota bacterium]|jgi:hypothetical protein
MKSKVALIIIYNHRYDKNIEVLENLYKTRFSNIYHLIPFYDGDKENVIAVYENSYRFQGYISQAFRTFYKDMYDHYFFVADDLMLNPAINENNYSDCLNISPTASYFPVFLDFNDDDLKWMRIRGAIEYPHFVPGVEFHKELPSNEEATRILRNAGFELKPILYKNAYTSHIKLNFKKDIIEGESSLMNKTNTIIRYIINRIKSSIHTSRNKTFHLKYPMVGGYSDIFVVSKSCIKPFVRYCGIFATSQMFVEFAIPTALLLSTKEIQTEATIDYKGKALWTEADYQMIAPFKNDLNQLISNFPKNHLYLHPIKLSKWKFITE